ncbi:MAG: cysteine dioxygenase family protein [Acidobacteria bacterium]|nr:cysteine dioxygenase family protein [Acidobacteriota bacterium]
MRVIDTTTAYATVSAGSAQELTLAELADFINQLHRLPTVEQITAQFASLLPRQRDYEAYRLFSAKKYARNLIARSDYAELLMLCWHSGQRTPIHDHGGSVGVVMVIEGSMTETMYEVAPEGHVRPYNTFRWCPGGITGAAVPDIHQLLNLQPPGRDLVTLHCYAPPLTVLNTFSPSSSRRRKWREGSFTGGAGI